ncbi:MAG TPA: hypothetical protein VHA73_09365 [Acidimicrobiales bacterium]|jgi:hypothetical protein|nr:hypothetical protein [Acidimicrobiales bacterium]
MRLEAHGGLAATVEDGLLRIGWGAPDWFGPGRAAHPLVPDDPVEMADDLGGATSSVVFDDGAVRLALRAYHDRAVLVLRAQARRDLDGLATGAFDRPSVPWPVFSPGERVEGGAPPGVQALAYQHCEFGLPAVSGPDLDGFFLLPHRPPTGWPLVLRAGDGRSLLVAPLGDFHEVTIGLNGGTVRCGWHGDLESVPAGFCTDLAVFAGDDPRSCIDEWARVLLERSGTVRPGRWADALAARPSYWTDNGAAYWYRTEPGHDPAGSVSAAVTELRDRGVPVGAVQLDSWFYPHEDLRPFDTDEWVVPPSAMMAWEPRPDVLPDGVDALRRRLGSPPLVAHIRHLSSAAPIAAELPMYVDGPYAAPATPEAYERWLDQCVAWGVTTFEHDWLVEVFFGVRGLRTRPGVARAWQEGIDRAARERGITLQWCMETPADLAQTTTLSQVTSVRTCGDHGYIATPGQLWAWFCVTNALARGLGLMPFKDVFRADPEVAGDNGEPEALLAALSTGPVGLGDRVGRMDPGLALRTCRADGRLIKPRVPVAATGASMFANTAFEPALMVAECHSDHPAGRWTYALALHCHPSDDAVAGDVDFAQLGESSPVGDVVVWDWRAQTASKVGPGHRWPVSLGREGWAYLVLAPVLDGDLAVIGDTTKFVTAGDARIEVASLDAASGGGVRLLVKGAGERVTVTGWSAGRPSAGDAPISHDPATGRWQLTVDVPERGWASVVVRPS